MKSFIIAMTNSQSSLAIANDCINYAKDFNVNVTLYPAVNGLDCDHKFKNYGITNFLLPIMHESAGNKGCFLSHYELWLKCVELNETLLILEHDGKIIRSLPDNIEEKFTDILNLDPNRPLSGDEYIEKANHSLTMPVDYFYAPAKKRSLAGEYVIGAHGYLIKPSGAKKLIDFSKNVGVLPTDKHIGRHIVDFKSTTVTIVSLHKFHRSHNMTKFSSTKNLSRWVD